mmetsp:Transcript_53945/g.80483  ORF Transcript_53945/g.80483 Transcript_53945/m.80483 type:complete len:95 (-) Transcript_53945:49-333(-)
MSILPTIYQMWLTYEDKSTLMKENDLKFNGWMLGQILDLLGLGYLLREDDKHDNNHELLPRSSSPSSPRTVHLVDDVGGGRGDLAMDDSGYLLF